MGWITWLIKLLMLHLAISTSEKGCLCQEKCICHSQKIPPPIWGVMTPKCGIAKSQINGSRPYCCRREEYEIRSSWIIHFMVKNIRERSASCVGDACLGMLLYETKSTWSHKDGWEAAGEMGDLVHLPFVVFGWFSSPPFPFAGDK